MPKRKKVKKVKIQLKQKQIVNIYTHSVRKSRPPLSKGSKPMPAMNNMPTFNPITRVQPVGTQTIELERRMNDEMTNLKKELSTLRELTNPLKDKVTPEHFNEIQEKMPISPAKTRTWSQMNALELRNELTAHGVSPEGMTKKQMIEHLNNRVA